ncbi:interferon-induced protein 44-like [Genypterus blacodes]|uniref:interferon-induced protein 44-like n=1 Tax=Genypterus blacodes TaxID=154954 RepID=UPI003F772FE8
MGRSASKPPSPTFEEPWRKIPSGIKEKNLQYVKNYQPHNTEAQHIRVLLQGPVGSGKSSFIKSVDVVLQGRMTGRALVNSTAGVCFTKKYTTYTFQKENHQTIYPFVFNDIMGLQHAESKGVSVEDIKLAMKGHVKEGHKFNSHSKLLENDPGYNREPTLNEKVHVLVCVIAADKIPITHEDVMKKMKEVREAASDLNIPQMALLTNIDEACQETKTNINNVYKSKLLKQRMEEFSCLVGLPLNCIFPVKNYHSEIYPDDDIDTLILSALRQMIDFGGDFLNIIRF